MKFEILLLLLICFSSCKEGNNDTLQPSDTDVVNEIEKAEEIPNNIDQKSTSNYTKSTVSKFVKYVESVNCKEYKDGEMYNCYEFYDAMIKNDFLQKVPFTANFPYDGSFTWEEMKDIDGMDNLWSDKCGFFHEKKNIKLNYYCPNIAEGAKVWLDSLILTNSFMYPIVDDYYRTQTFSPQSQQAMILSSGSSLDFNNIDHRAFLWFYHLTLSAEMLANRDFNRKIK